MKENTLFKELKRQAQYAICSLSRNLIYQIYGRAVMAFELEAITKAEFYELNTMLIVEVDNNPRDYKLF